MVTGMKVGIGYIRDARVGSLKGLSCVMAKSAKFFYENENKPFYIFFRMGFCVWLFVLFG